MTYKKNLVACLKVGGKILRERGDQVDLPFGSEYSILLKNLDSVRVKAKITIDGQDVGSEFVVPSNSSIEIERFIRNGNFDRGNKFKFIERTGQIEDTRGIKEDDGLVRIEFQKEKVIPAPIRVPKIVWDEVHVPYHPYTPWYGGPYYRHLGWGNGISYTSAQTSVSGSIGSASGGSESFVRSMNCSVNTQSNLNDAGITVPGSESQQKFYQAAWFQTEDQSEVIVLHLKGRQGEKPVKKAVTVDVKPVCETCKLTNKATSKFCSRCGTSLQLI